MTQTRPERTDDAAAIRRVNERAFGAPAEADLVDRLRAAGKSVVSLVAVQGDVVVGHILFSPISVTHAPASFRGVGLAPMSVLPEFQRTGIGSQLVLDGLEACRRAGYDAVVVLGHTGFYPRFGFVKAEDHRLDNEYEASDAFMVLELESGALKGVSGLVKFAPEFQAVDEHFAESVEHLRRGDFSLSEPLFAEHSALQPCQVVRWLTEGRFRDIPDVLREAFTCAAFLGKTSVLKSLLDQGVDTEGGAATGMNALHWAVNRGQLEAVQLLLDAGAPPEVRNDYGGTALGAAVWATLHEPRPSHPAIVEALLKAGARVETVDYPTGVDVLDGLLRRYGAKSDA